jgi:hypothetical protein
MQEGLPIVSLWLKGITAKAYPALVPRRTQDFGGVGQRNFWVLDQKKLSAVVVAWVISFAS